VTDAGYPYDDDDVEQVFSVIAQPDKSFTVGSWVHTRDLKNGKTEDDVERYSIDPVTGDDHIEKLTGLAAQDWKRQICTPSNALLQPSIGQASKVCRSVLRISKPH
jgi:hypothetical protein